MDTQAATDRVLAFMNRDCYLPMRKRTLARALDITEDDYPAFRRLLQELARNGSIIEAKKGKYGLPRPGDVRREQSPSRPKPASRCEDVGDDEPESGEEKAGPKPSVPKGARVGRIDVKRGGMGFLLSDPPGNDVFIGPEDLGGALSGDLVAVIMKRRRQQGGRQRKEGWGGANYSRPVGEVVQVIERAHPRVVGTFSTKPPDGDWPKTLAGIVIPDTRGMSSELEVLTGDAGQARNHDKVIVELVETTDTHRSGERPTARVVHVFGKAGDADADIAAILANFNIRQEFPEAVLRQTEEISEEISAEELAQRTCYFEPITFTIDPEDARDHDDAVALRREADGRVTLLVHIADVSHYIPEGSAIDMEARERGTSVYLPGQVFPMLPPKLSNNMCSLKEGQVRLTKTARITFGPNLTPLDVRIERSYIRSAAFLTYDQVKEALEQEKPELVRSQAIYDALCDMRKFAGDLRRKRLATGSIDLDIPEAKLLLDDKLEVRGWIQEEHHWAHELIEDMMLAANRAVAEYLVEHEIPALFRIHEDPDPDALQRFADFARDFGISLRPPFDRLKLKSVLDRVRGKEYAHTIHMALLTSLKQARYSAECRQHFALNFLRYLHFTSPIRRYPDLIVHRALDGVFAPGEAVAPAHGKKRGGGEKGKDHFARLAFLRPLATQCSVLERNADNAEKEVIKFRQLQFLRRNPKPTHPGLITGVREFGLFVELQDCYVEGLVHVQDMDDDYYEYFENQHSLRGRRTRKTYRLGDKIAVRIQYIDLGKKEVGLAIV